MSKSYDWCLARVKTGVSNYTDRFVDISKAAHLEEIDSAKLFDMYLHGVRKFTTSFTDDEGVSHTVNIELEFNPDSEDFQYFSSNSTLHDGTLLFIEEAYEKIMRSVLAGYTYYLPSGTPKGNIRYKLGNFVMLNEYGNFGNKERPWLHERTTVLLPIRYETW